MSNAPPPPGPYGAWPYGAGPYPRVGPPAETAPLLPRISAKRAYAEVLGVFLGFFAAGIAAAGLLLGGRSKDLPDTGSWGVYMTQVVSILADVGLAVTLVMLLGARRGVTPAVLGLRVPRQPDGRVAVKRTIRIMAWCMFALIIGGIFNALLQSGHLPMDKPTAPELIFGTFDALQAGIIEELVVLAFVVVTLRQAGRPWWEVTLVALVLRGSYHIYYGPGVFGILIWAGLYYWTYLRFRQLAPMMVCHALWDLVGFFSQRWTFVVGIGLGAVAVLWITAIILWLTDTSPIPRVGMVGPAEELVPTPPPPAGTPVGGSPAPPGHSGPALIPLGWPTSAWPLVSPSGPVLPPGSLGPLSSAASSGSSAGDSPGGSNAPPGPAPRPELPPPGWHPDPSGVNRWRWWDGRRWTDHVSHHSGA